MYRPIARLRLGIRLADGPRPEWLELRLPDAADLTALAALAEAGVDDPAMQPFSVAWTDVEPAARARSVLQYHWRFLGAWEPADWTLNMVVVHGGTVVGTQGLSASDYAILREVSTGSDDGMTRHVIRRRPAESRRLRLDRESWRAAREALRPSLGEVTIDRLEPCLPLFGLG